LNIFHTLNKNFVNLLLL